MPCNCNCGCPGCTCNSALGLGSFHRIPPRAEHGFRLSIPGGPAGGQYHGRVTANPTELAYHGRLARTLSGIHNGDHHLLVDPHHRAPGELPPRPNAAGDLNIHTIGHALRTPGYAMVPGGLFPATRLGALPVVNEPSGPTQSWPSKLPVVTAPPSLRFPPGAKICGTAVSIDPVTGQVREPVCWTVPPDGGPPAPPPNNTTTVPPPGAPGAPTSAVPDHCAPWQFRDAAGNCTDLRHHPYPVPIGPAQPAPVVPAPTNGTPTAGQPGCVTGQFDAAGNCIPSTVPGAVPNWFTDPAQELISGIPNWGLVAGGAGAFLLLMIAMQRGGRR